MPLDQDPNWLISALIGAVFGYLLPLLPASLRYLVGKFRRSQLEGLWHQCNYTFSDGRQILCREEWKIARGFLHPYALKVSGLPGDGRRYRGQITHERNHLIAIYQASTHTETVYARFHFPATPEGQVVPGIWLSFDHDGCVTAGVQVLSQTKLTDAECLQAIRQCSKMITEVAVLQIAGLRFKGPNAKKS